MICITFAAILLLAFYLRRVIEGRFLASLGRIRAKAEELNLEDYMEPLDIRSSNEVVNLARAFNDMAVRLKVSHGQLKSRERLLQSILESTDNGITLLKQREHVWHNRSVSRMLGWDHAEFARDAGRVLFPSAEAHQQVMDWVYSTVRSEGRFRMEYALRHKDGRQIPCLVTGQAVDSQDPDQGIVFTLTDISRQKRDKQRIRDLTQDLLNSQERERKRIALDLHDNVAQDLSMLLIKPEDPGVEIDREGYHRILKKAIRSIREIAYDLRPSSLDQFGLGYAVEQLCKEHQAAFNTPMQCSCAGVNQLDLDQAVSINLYRVIQEALNNTQKHAAATQISVKLVHTHPRLIIRIQDDGRGFDPAVRLEAAAEERRMGIAGMKERVSMLGGTLAIESRPGKGTKVHVELTVPGDQE